MNKLTKQVNKIAGGMLMATLAMIIMALVLHPVMIVCVLGYLAYHWRGIKEWAEKP